MRDLPILLYLRDHAAAITADPAKVSLAALLRSTLGDLDARAQEGTDDLLRRLGQAIALDELTANPLLTMIANVHRYRGRVLGHGWDTKLTDFDAEYEAILRTRWPAVIGRSLAQAVGTAIGERTLDTWPAAFSKALAAQVGMGDRTRRPNLDALADKLARAVATLRRALSRQDDTAATSWAATVAERLAENADPIFCHEQRLTRGTTTNIGLAALCLAGEADRLRELGGTFREIAAGITPLDLRPAADHRDHRARCRLTDIPGRDLSSCGLEFLAVAPGRVLVIEGAGL